MNQRIENFLQTFSEKPKIIVVYGPTASGKTALGIEVAKEIGGEIISTDSRQIFEHLNIGTGKVTQDEMQGIVHHMIDIISPKREYSVGEFKSMAQEIIGEIHSRGKIPLLVGGTGLYIDSLVYDFDIPKVPASAEIRFKYEKMAQEYGNMRVYEELQNLDPHYAQELHPNNLSYVIRALEVKILTGKSKKDFRSEKTLRYDTLFLTPYDGKRDVLYDRINARVAKMFDDGLVHEVKNLLESGFSENDFGLKTIGYSEVIQYLKGDISLEKCIELVQQHNRNYAKRQLTWFTRYER